MAEEFPVPPADDITEQDKLMAALAYPIPLVAIIMLLVEEMKERPFQKYHAVQALAVNVVLWIVIVVAGCVLGVLSALVGGLCGFIAPLLWLVTLYWAYEAYQGKYFEVPVVTDFLKGQSWL
jgi:uncharacterized membrane protein